jgi:2-iminoacetate synthase ThiH
MGKRVRKTRSPSKKESKNERKRAENWRFEPFFVERRGWNPCFLCDAPCSICDFRHCRTSGSQSVSSAQVRRLLVTMLMIMIARVRRLIVMVRVRSF